MPTKGSHKDKRKVSHLLIFNPLILQRNTAPARELAAFPISRKFRISLNYHSEFSNEEV
jgi:hypothetical protein